MNLFRSEGHAKNWSGFKAGTEAAILSCADLMEMFETQRHSAKYSGNYVSSAPDYAPAFFEKIKTLTGNAAFWSPAP